MTEHELTQMAARAFAAMDVMSVTIEVEAVEDPPFGPYESHTLTGFAKVTIVGRASVADLRVPAKEKT